MESYNIMVERLDKMQSRSRELEEILMKPEILGNSREYAKLAKEQASLRQVVDAYVELKTIIQHIKEAETMLKEKDTELRELAEAELEELNPQKDALLEKLEVLLIPKDPNDDHNAIVEIRGAAGGDEGNIFAGDLFRMYSRYAELMGWKIEIMEASEAEAGGYTLISFYVKGNEPFKHLKFESGSHRVQRVPKTETQGRIHTSTATVLVMPDIEEEEIDINPADLVIETHRSSGAGGQHVNKTDSAVRITHTPTGISVNCQDGRSQHDNRDKAMKALVARVYDYFQSQQTEAIDSERKSKVGTGDRAEKIRTYNYPQNRVTDHRIGLTIQQLDRIIEGKLDDIITALINEDQRLKLEGQK